MYEHTQNVEGTETEIPEFLLVYLIAPGFGHLRTENLE